jgi:type IV pilus assembly protein PilM
MQDKPDSTHTLGLDFTFQTIRGVQLTQRKGKPVVVQLFDLPLATSSEESPRYSFVQEQPQFLPAVSKNLVVTTLPSGATLVRQLEVKLKKIADIDAVLAFQAEPALPYPVENASLDRVILGETSEGRQLTLMAVRKDHLQQHLELWRSLEVEPEVVTATPAALAAFAQTFGPSDKLQSVIHIGLYETVCILMKEGKLLAAQVCYMGLHQLQGEVHSESLEQLRMEITRTLYSLSKQAKGQEIEQLIVTGDGAADNQFVSNLLEPIGKPFFILEPPEGYGITLEELQRYAIPLGAALMAFPGAEQINFRQDEYAYPEPWKRYKKPLLFYLGLCLAFAAAILFAGNAYIHYQEDDLRKEYSELLQALNKPYTDFEKHFSKSETVIPINQLGQEELMSRLKALQKDIQSAPEHYPLLPNVPTVSDFLAWLSTHPNVVEKDPKTNTLKPLLQLESFSYTLQKRPEQTKKQEKYQVKVEVEFSSETPKAAREFHDALIAPNVMVDPKGEVKWSTNRGLYRASFFLKDKTLYPTASN